MKIEFFTDEDSCQNVRFAGDLHANNETILTIFYDYPTVDSVEQLIRDVDRVLGGMEGTLEFGDMVDGELDSANTLLKPEGIDSNTYQLKTSEFKSVLEKWKSFLSKDKPNLIESIKLDAQIV